eukprot:3123224-Prorocentrum_lima.AAC.1
MIAATSFAPGGDGYCGHCNGDKIRYCHHLPFCRLRLALLLPQYPSAGRSLRLHLALRISGPPNC